MIDFKNSQISDILPYTEKNNNKIALSHALHSVFSNVYTKLLQVRLWQDIDNADPKMLDIMASELNCLFYLADADENVKRKIIKAAFISNRRIGTVGAVQNISTQILGESTILSEWYQYGGSPFNFKIDTHSHMSQDTYEQLVEIVQKTKNVRSKLEGVKVHHESKANMNIAIVKTLQHIKTVVQSAPYDDLN